MLLALLLSSVVGCKYARDSEMSGPPLTTNSPPPPPWTATLPPDTSPPPDDHKIKLVRVFYATDRKPTGASNPVDFYGGERIAANAPMGYGICDVTIPPHHQFARMEEAKWYRFEFKNVPEKHVTLTNVQPYPVDPFFATLRRAVSDSTNKEIFLFIHGYNVTWEDSARRAGQIAYDIGLTPARGAPFLYSWASQGEMSKYLVDDNNVKTAAQRLRTLLTNVVAQAGAQRINILAHSMGNQALNIALELMGTAMPDAAVPPFDQVIMAAPDLDVNYLELSAAAVRKTARKFTIYSCRSDRPVRMSTWLRGDQARVGSFALLEGFDTIDATLVEIDGMLNHSYIGDAPPVLRDLRKLVQYGCGVTARCCCCFKTQTEPGGTRNYWTFHAGNVPTCTHPQACQ